MDQLRRDMPTGVIEGSFDPGWRSVVDAFAANFDQRDEVGASLCITHDGATVVDVWGGAADPGTVRPWEAGTVSVVHSCTKGATALCAHVLASRGLLDVEAPVAEYWPEFAANGKDRTVVRMMLDHSAGVPVFRGPLERGELYHWDRIVARLQAEEPFWEPGTRNGYHLLNFGWTVGELVRRVSGRSLGQFFAEEIAGPLRLDFWIGLPEDLEPRVAPMIPYQRSKGEALSAFALDVVRDRSSLPGLAVATIARMEMNSREAHEAEIGGGGGITNARGLAGMYRPLAAGGEGLVDPATLARMRAVSVATNDDAVLRMPTRFALGFMVSMDNRARVGAGADSVILGDRAFGHVGAGGSIGFADIDHGLAFGYSMNRMGPGILMNERGQSLIDAANASLQASQAEGKLV